MCGQDCPPEDLMRKKVDFVTLGGVGRRAKTVKSRTTDWLCPDCLAKDPAWQVEKYNTPGMQSPALNRVRAAQELRENGNGGSTGPRAQEPEVPAERQSSAGSEHAGHLPVAVHDGGSARGGAGRGHGPLAVGAEPVSQL